MVSIKGINYILLNKKINDIYYIDKQISDADKKRKDIISKLSGNEKEYNDIKNEYENLLKMNTELNDSINNCDSELAEYDRMISDIEYKIDNYNKQ